MIFGLEESRCEVRLRMLELTTLEERSLEEKRQRADMIEVFKIVSGIEGLQINHFFDLRGISSTRGHSLKFIKKRFRLNWRKYTFGNRVVDEWNLLPEEIVSCKNLNAFKEKLDHYLRIKGTSAKC